jgi:hypothetical protein
LDQRHDIPPQRGKLIFDNIEPGESMSNVFSGQKKGVTMENLITQLLTEYLKKKGGK